MGAIPSIKIHPVKARFLRGARDRVGRSVSPARSRYRPGAQPVVPNPEVARIVVDGQTPSSAAAAATLLLKAFGSRWPQIGRALFTITPGGFVRAAFPRNWRGNVGWASTPGDFKQLVRAADPTLQRVLSRNVIDAARKRTRFLTVGIDLINDARHAELVALVDCRNGDVIRWTGKSYPTGFQARQLVQVADLSSHFIRVEGERVLVLGCHDLNMFSARSRANQHPDGVRRSRCDEMLRRVARFQPTVVLQHPHSTDSPNVWRMPWACLVRDVPSVRVWASGIGYFSWDDGPRGDLQDVLAATRSRHGVIDIVVNGR